MATATTNHALPVPEDGDDFHASDDIADLAYAVDEALGEEYAADSTALVASVAAGWTVNLCRIRRNGHLVSIFFSATYSGATLTADSSANLADVPVATLVDPSIYPPDDHAIYVARAIGAPYGGRINTAGQIVLVCASYPGQTLQETYWLNWDTTYWVE